ncbi:hypothetical protein HRbin17_01266 [bacterium HR17]|jgi:hypothetical protein|uniref:Uncharacterized protein n=1 Tax=Candidatus Fervidibacter japonicus TaxID=2035412 RepID=A0A2H5XC42_9BACT|nr:hypothetical protein HRbin17_01266 [bacterium HR17]
MADFKPSSQLESCVERKDLPLKMEFEWGYLWTEVEVLSGEVQVFWSF